MSNLKVEEVFSPEELMERYVTAVMLISEMQEIPIADVDFTITEIIDLGLLHGVTEH